MRFKDNKACVVCANCKEMRFITRLNKADQIRLEHIYDWVLASIRSQGYQKGYLCRKCQKKLGIDTREVEHLCKKHLTRSVFNARKNLQITVL